MSPVKAHEALSEKNLYQTFQWLEISFETLWENVLDKLIFVKITQIDVDVFVKTVFSHFCYDCAIDKHHFTYFLNVQGKNNIDP